MPNIMIDINFHLSCIYVELIWHKYTRKKPFMY